MNFKIKFKQVQNLLYRLFTEFLHLIYKENCVSCGKTLDMKRFSDCSKNDIPLCKSCLNSVEILSGFAHSKIEGVEIYSACFYDGIIKKLIHDLKFHHKLCVSRVLGYILSKFYTKILEQNNSASQALKNTENIVVVPIPTNKKNIQTRGYNNVFEIAKEFSSFVNLRVLENFLIKIKDTKPQFEMNAKTRKTNVEGCFGVNKKCYNGEFVLVIDDIITTGSTLKEAILALKKAGVKNIICLTLSKSVK